MDMAEILHPDWITIEENGRPVHGYNQEWYPEKWQKLAGCGPTAGAMMAAYIERKQWGKKGDHQGRGPFCDDGSLEVRYTPDARSL